jgi:hypothetical protein
VNVQTEPFRKVADKSAADICARVALSGEARAFLLPTLSPQGYLGLLLANEHYADAVRFLAFALPIREGVWWACVMARVNLQAEPQPGILDALKAAEAWVYTPDDAVRRQCLAHAETLNFEGAASYAALAAFWSGGSMAPEGMPDVLPDAKLGPTGVGAAILLAVTGGPPLQMNDRFLEAIARGIDIANGGNGQMKNDARSAVSANLRNAR